MRRDRYKLFLVEEDELLADVTSFRLELLGYDVRCAHDADSALRSMADDPPDLCIIDLELPGADGAELITRLRSQDATAAAPVLAFSVDANLDLVERAYAAGAADYLVTPYDPAVLQAKIEHLLTRKETPA